MNRRTRGLAAGVAALGAGAILVGPVVALAQPDDDTDDPTSETTGSTLAPERDETSDDESSDRPSDVVAPWLEDGLQAVLEPLVEDGTLTRAQADAVVEAVQDARPVLRGEWPGGERGRHGPGRLFGAALHGVERAAEAIGISEEELVDAVVGGRTLAEVAEDNGVEPQAVIDALVAAAAEWLDQAVEDGHLDQGEADVRRAELTERITELVDEGPSLRFDLDELPRRGDDGPDRPDDDTDGRAPTTTSD